MVKIEAAYSSETSVPVYRRHALTSETVIPLIFTVRTSDLTFLVHIQIYRFRIGR
jgi:hypothetical protein